MSKSLLFWILRRLLRGHLAGYKQAVADELALTLEGLESVLDVGCDDGTHPGPANATQRQPLLEGVHIQPLLPSSIPTYDATHLPYADNSFDAVIAIDVQYHIRNIPQLLAEMTLVSRKLVMLKHHRLETHLAWWRNGVGDWMIKAPFGIPCTFNFPSLWRWQRHFKQGLVMTRTQSRGCPPFKGSTRSSCLAREASC